MEIKSLLFILRMLCLASPMVAQEPDARDILNHTTDAFRREGGMKVGFSVRAPEGNSNGTICLKGDKSLLETEGMKMWFDGRTQWSYPAFNDEINVSKPTPKELQSINPYSRLSLYNQDYKLKVAKIGNTLDNTTYRVVMTATKQSQNIQCLILHIEKGSFRPSRLSMVRRGSRDAVVVFINSYQAGKSYNDSLFVFDKRAFPTAEIIDLR